MHRTPPIIFHMMMIMFTAMLDVCEANPVDASTGFDSPAQLLAASRDAIGSNEALAAIETRISKGEFILQGRAAPLTVVQARPAQFRLDASFPIGKLSRGTNGKIAWEMHPLRGGRILTASERDLVKRNAHFDQLAEAKERFPEQELLDVVSIEGKQLLPVRFSDASGKQETWYFDTDSLLPARIEREIDGGPGEPLKIHTYLSDWRDVDGVMIPHRVSTGTATREVEYRFDSITHNQAIDTARFDVPAELAGALSRNAH